LAQIIFDALRQLIREEIDAALNRAESDRADKEGYASGMWSAAAITSPGKPTLA
jgi:hypothetical protein